MNEPLINSIFEDDIIAKLNEIKTANGYLDDISVLNGYLVHYAKDLLSGDKGLTFPCVAAQLGSDDIVKTDGTGSKAKIARTVRLVGAVDTKDRSTVSKRLSDLVYQVRCAIAIDTYDNVSKAMDIVIGGAEYDLPKAGDQYAYFEMTVTIEFNEDWKKP